MKTFLIPQGLPTEEEHVARNVTALMYSINPPFYVPRELKCVDLHLFSLLTELNIGKIMMITVLNKFKPHF